MTLDIAWQHWRDKAAEVPLMEAAIKCGAVLKRAGGAEHVGPCPACGGSDRFSINPAKQVWNCRGHGGGGSVIDMVMHIAGVDFKAACELLTGEAPPSGGSGRIDEEARQRAREARERAEAKARELEAEAALSETQQRDRARRIWGESKPISGTAAERYLIGRGIPAMEWPECLRFHQMLPYPGGVRHPALICRVDDMFGEPCAIWRIYITNEGQKAPVENAKLGLGPAGGGAVRLFAPTDRYEVGLCEGVETAFGAHLVSGRPVWACLSTSGLTGFQAPMDVSAVWLFADSDAPGFNLETGKLLPAPGMRAARAAAEAITGQSVRVLDVLEPGLPGMDWLDVWNATKGRMAA